MEYRASEKCGYSIRPQNKVRFEFIYNLMAVDRRVFGISKPAKRLSNEREYWDCFENGGIAFISKRKRQAIPGTAHGVYIDKRNGKMVIAARRVTVRFYENVSDKEAMVFIRKLGMQCLGKEKYAKNTFSLGVIGDEGPIDKIAQMDEVCGDKIVYKTMEVLETIVPREDGSGLLDPNESSQWHLDRMQVRQTWQEGFTGRGVKVAVIDQGFNIDNVDLRDGISGSGHFIELIGGRARFSKDPSTISASKHGTFCSTLAVARRNRKRGVGIAYNASWFPISVYEKNIASTDTFPRAIAYAVNPSIEDGSINVGAGADVISCSLALSMVDRPDIEAAVEYAKVHGRRGKGVLFLYAVANTNSRISNDPIASIDNVLAIGRSTINDKRYQCAKGPELECVAPGINVMSSFDRNLFGSNDGCSFSTPIAAGVIALMIEAAPGADWSKLRESLRRSCDKVDQDIDYINGRNDSYGYGRVNAHSAVAEVRRS